MKYTLLLECCCLQLMFADFDVVFGDEMLPVSFAFHDGVNVRRTASVLISSSRIRHAKHNCHMKVEEKRRRSPNRHEAIVFYRCFNADVVAADSAPF